MSVYEAYMGLQGQCGTAINILIAQTPVVQKYSLLSHNGPQPLMGPNVSVIPQSTHTQN